MNTFRSRQAPVFSCGDGTVIKAGSDCRFIEITQNDKTYKVFASTFLACKVDNNDLDCPQIGGRGVAATDKPYIAVKAHEATCGNRAPITPIFLSIFPNSGETIDELEARINSFVCACCNGGGSDEDWTRVANVAVYNVTEKIGIGTDVPERQLDLVGDARFQYENSNDTPSTYQLEFGVIDTNAISPATTSEGYRLSVLSAAGNGVEEFAIGDDAVLGVEGLWQKTIQTSQGGNSQTHIITALADGLSLSSANTLGEVSTVTLQPDGGIRFGSVTNGGADNLAVILDNNGVTITLQPASAHRVKIENLQTFADNAAALGGGLVADDVYKTATGELRIVV